MSKRTRKQIRPEIEKETDYYQLKKQAINDLVEADETNSPPVSEEELRKYTSGSKFRMADWMKMLLIKFWFAGAVCFYFIWGLGIYMADVLDTLLVTGIAMGIVTDLLTNNALRFFAKTKGENDRFIMVTRRGYSSYVLNILYSCFVLFFVYLLYTLINGAAASATAETDRVVLGVEPILFGIFYLAFDMLFIEIKHFIQARLMKKQNA